MATKNLHFAGLLKAKDDAGGDARLVLGIAVEAGGEVVGLDGADRNVGNDLDVNAAANGRGKTGVAVREHGVVANGIARREEAEALRLAGSAEEHVGEKGDARGEFWRCDARKAKLQCDGG